MNNAEVIRDPGSFRDPAGHVYLDGDRVLRTVSVGAAADYEFVRDNGLLDRLHATGRLIACSELASVAAGALASAVPAPRYVLEHPRIRFVSYPYEWPFVALRAAALLHLDLHLEALQVGATLVDATAYNIQFQGPLPVFIDVLSLRRYREGEFWLGHRQFCEQFLNPLLLQSLLGIAYHDWYRGHLEGIPTADLARLLPAWRRWTPRVLAHVTLHARLQAGSGGRTVDIRGRRLPKAAYAGMLRQLRGWIASLRTGPANTTWSQYATANSYGEASRGDKLQAVAEFAASVRPALLLDVGCNTGEFAAAALAAGAQSAVGLDGDQGALQTAYDTAVARRLDFLPLYSDLCNPSPDQGWGQVERGGLARRCRADAAIALALVHHLAIGRNIPLPAVVDWLLSLAPNLLVEFVPKDDAMVQTMLRNREDIFPDYSADTFRAILAARCRIVAERALSGSGRRLFRCAR